MLHQRVLVYLQKNETVTRAPLNVSIRADKNSLLTDLRNYINILKNICDLNEIEITLLTFL